MKKIKMIINILMYLLFIILMCHHITLNLIHEILGIILFVLFIVHHAGAMIPFFAGRIENILQDKKNDFKKFYVDTAILDNSKALELTIDYFGISHVLYGTDAPFGIMPNGATKEIEEAINVLPISSDDKEKIYSQNLKDLIIRNV